MKNVTWRHSEPRDGILNIGSRLRAKILGHTVRHDTNAAAFGPRPRGKDVYFGRLRRSDYAIGALDTAKNPPPKNATASQARVDLRKGEERHIVYRQNMFLPATVPRH